MVREKNLAEVTGFEPAMSYPIHAFQACAFNHSATLPLPAYRLRGRKRQARQNNVFSPMVKPQGEIKPCHS